MATLILLRHGESAWNQDNLFAGWVDVALTAKGIGQAQRAGALLREHGVLPDVAHTSILQRTVDTADVTLNAAGRPDAPTHRSWRLNERHYGALQGLDKAAVRRRYGDEQFTLWRRSYDVPPPPLDEASARAQRNDPRYAVLGEDLPVTESLRDVAGRLLPYWRDAIGLDLRAGRTALVVAHSNSLRALIKHLDRLSDDAVVDVNVPTGVPLRYEIDDATLEVAQRPGYLDPKAAAEGIAVVAAQGGAPVHTGAPHQMAGGSSINP
jgi:2,3-bisphosphoglycerate-dependent phosphoglycerate mutase